MENSILLDMDWNLSGHPLKMAQVDIVETIWFEALPCGGVDINVKCLKIETPISPVKLLQWHKCAQFAHVIMFYIVSCKIYTMKDVCVYETIEK
jgi:hypothetical protein